MPKGASNGQDTFLFRDPADLCAQAVFACSEAAATILHDAPANGSIAAATQRAFGESRGAEVRSL